MPLKSPRLRPTPPACLTEMSLCVSISVPQDCPEVLCSGCRSIARDDADSQHRVQKDASVDGLRSHCEKAVLGTVLEQEVPAATYPCRHLQLHVASRRETVSIAN